ncbi:hypothetical protein [Sagittula sp. S175]|uniref:hypothetical protein n=1 Tax=Sagittula sp. S175 TaxID=3415129 RepID=UPI003C7D79BC
MTPEQELRGAILATDPGSAQKARAKALARAEKRARRESRAAASFARRMVIRLIVLGMSLGGSAMMLYTEQGQELRRDFQAALLEVVETQMEARYGVPNQVEVQQVSAQDVAEAEIEAEGSSVGISWLSARGSEPETVPGGKAKVSVMPESRVAIRRAGQ